MMDGACLGITEGGGFWSVGNVPKDLFNKLKSRNPRLSKPILAAMGSYGRYYLGFEDGTFKCYGSEKFMQAIRDIGGIETVSFGESFESFFIVGKQGQYRGFDLPSNMSIRLNEVRGVHVVTGGSLGPDDRQYFLKVRTRQGFQCYYEDGGMNIQDDIEQHDFQPRQIRSVVFGYGNEYFLRYT
jgi:hypothetical protein